MKSFAYFLTLSAGVLVQLAGICSAKDALRLELDEVAKEIKAIAAQNGGGTVGVGGFGEPPDALGSSSPSIQDQLTLALQGAGLSGVSKDASFQAAGTYLGKEEADTGMLKVRINVILSKKNGDILKLIQRDIFGQEAVPRLLGVSVSQSPNASPVEQHRNFRKAKEKPQVDVKGSTVRTSSASPYGVELLVKAASKDGTVSTFVGNAGYRAASVSTRKEIDGKASAGLPFVPIQRGQVFAVKLINESPHQAAVNLSLDGINCFRFSEVKSTYWIIPSKSFIVVPGWHKNNEKSIEFKSTEFPESATAKLNLKPSTAVGTISAAFSHAWIDDSDRPPGARSRAAGFGDELQFKTRQVKREIGSVVDNIVVRYERP